MESAPLSSAYLEAAVQAMAETVASGASFLEDSPAPALSAIETDLGQVMH